MNGEPTPAHAGPDCLEPLLDELEAVLAQQAELAARGEFHRLPGLIDQTDSLLGRAAKLAGSAEPALASRLRRAQRLHEKVCLTLAATRDETLRALRHLGRGRKALDAYRR
jgi:prophage DNA circulation protein